MTFTYYYKTSDGLRHEAEIDAPSRDEAFAALRERGIRPIKVIAKEAPVPKGGMRWRMTALAVAIAAVIAVTRSSG